MQERHLDRESYFAECATSAENHYIPYLKRFLPSYEKSPDGLSVLEIGCGSGGNLAPFAKMGCRVTGIDLNEPRIINEARPFFEKNGLKGTFIVSDIFEVSDLQQRFDLVIVHDVLEHIDRKALFMNELKKYLNKDGIIFMAFPAWQMPFGGHQQMAQNKTVARLPFIHLLPEALYVSLLKWAKESDDKIAAFLDIRKTRVTVEMFYRLLAETGYSVVDKCLWLINPHYEVKFGMKPRRLPLFIGNIPYLRNFFITSGFWILKKSPVFNTNTSS